MDSGHSNLLSMGPSTVHLLVLFRPDIHAWLHINKKQCSKKCAVNHYSQTVCPIHKNSDGTE